MQQYEVNVIAEARDDIANLIDFYEETAGVESALRFEGAVWEALNSLGFLPSSNPIWEAEEGLRRLNMHSHKVAIIYSVDDRELKVIAVQAFHTSAAPKKQISALTRRLEELVKRT